MSTSNSDNRSGKDKTVSLSTSSSSPSLFIEFHLFNELTLFIEDNIKPIYRMGLLPNKINLDDLAKYFFDNKLNGHYEVHFNSGNKMQVILVLKEKKEKT